MTKYYPKKNQFIDIYIKGPPNDEVFKIVIQWVLKEGYDSNGYAMIHRMIQQKIKEKYEVPD